MLLRRVSGEVEETLRHAAEGGDVFPLSTAQGIERGFERLCHKLSAGGLGAPQQGREVVLAVAHGTGGHLDVTEGGQRAADIHLAHEGGAGAGVDGAGPGNDEGYAGAALQQGVFAAAPGVGGLVPGAGFTGTVFIAIGNDRPVIAGEDDEGFLRFVAGLLQGGHEAAQGVIHLQGHIAADAEPAFAAEAGVRVARHVDIIRAEVEEQGLAGTAGDEALRSGGDVICNVLIFPEGGGAAAHVADAGDAVDDGIGMLPVTGASPGLEQLRVGGGCFLAGVGIPFVVHMDGFLRVEVTHFAILHIDAGHAVARGGHDEGVIEAHVCRSGGDGTVPVNVAAAQAQVPLADGRGAVACLLHEGAQRGGLVSRGQDEGCIPRQDAGALLPPGILPGEQRVARGGAHGVGAVRIGEEQSLVCKALHIRARDLLTAVD